MPTRICHPPFRTSRSVPAFPACDSLLTTLFQNKLDAQYAMKLEAALGDAGDLKQQLELKAQENRSITASLESLRGTNAELEVRLIS